MRISPLPALLLFLGLIGCGPSGPTKYEVTGTVTFDGKPISTGEIVFRPKDSKVGPDGGKIVDGAFKVRVVAGTHTVEIQATKLVPLPEDERGALDEKEGYKSYIPEKYNVKSELTAEVSGPKELKFELKSE